MLPSQPTSNRQRRRAVLRRCLGVELLEKRMTPAAGVIDQVDQVNQIDQPDQVDQRIDPNPRQPNVAIEVLEPTVQVVEGQAGQFITLVLRISGSGTAAPPLFKPLEVALKGNADYFASSGVFPVGSKNGDQIQLLVTAVDDLLFEEDAETFPKEMLVLTPSIAGVAVGSVGVVVRDNERIAIVVDQPSVVVNEGGPSQSVELKLSLTGTGQGVAMLATSVSFRLPGNSDYVSGSATFAAGALDGATKLLSVAAVDDQLFELLNESFADEPLLGDPQNARATADRVDVLVIDNDFFLARPLLEEMQRPVDFEAAVVRTREFDVQQPPFIYRRVVTELFLAGYGGGQLSDLPRSDPSFFPWLPDHLADSLSARKRATQQAATGDEQLEDALASFSPADEALNHDAVDLLGDASARAWQRIASQRPTGLVAPAGYESEADATPEGTTTQSAIMEAPAAPPASSEVAPPPAPNR